MIIFRGAALRTPRILRTTGAFRLDSWAQVVNNRRRTGAFRFDLWTPVAGGAF